MRMPKEGAFQILKGRMGSLAIRDSQYAKAAKWMMEMMRRTIS